MGAGQQLPPRESGSGPPQGPVLRSALSLTERKNRCLSPCRSVVLITIIVNGSRMFRQMDVLQFS